MKKSITTIVIVVIAIFTANTALAKKLPSGITKTSINSELKQVTYSWSDSTAEAKTFVKAVVYADASTPNKLIVTTKTKSSKKVEVSEVPFAKDANKLQIIKTKTGLAFGFEDRFERNISIPILLASTSALAQN